MTDTDSRFTADRAVRASVGLTTLAAVLLTFGAAVEATGNFSGPSANAPGGGAHPTTTHQSPHPQPSGRIGPVITPTSALSHGRPTSTLQRRHHEFKFSTAAPTWTARSRDQAGNNPSHKTQGSFYSEMSRNGVRADLSGKPTQKQQVEDRPAGPATAGAPT